VSGKTVQEIQDRSRCDLTAGLQGLPLAKQSHCGRCSDRGWTAIGLKAAGDHDVILYFEIEMGNVSTNRILRLGRVGGILKFPPIGELYDEPLRGFAIHP
jgi:hypothetical protein